MQNCCSNIPIILFVCVSVRLISHPTSYFAGQTEHRCSKTLHIIMIIIIIIFVIYLCGRVFFFVSTYENNSRTDKQKYNNFHNTQRSELAAHPSKINTHSHKKKHTKPNKLASNQNCTGNNMVIKMRFACYRENIQLVDNDALFRYSEVENPKMCYCFVQPDVDDVRYQTHQEHRI